jgi:hypothetical protein
VDEPPLSWERKRSPSPTPPSTPRGSILSLVIDGVLVMSDQILMVEFFAAEPQQDIAAGNPQLEQINNATTRMEIEGE